MPGTVAGLHLAWKECGKLPWERLVEPAIALARDGFPLSESLAGSLAKALPSMKKYPASLAQFSKNGEPYGAGERFAQPDLARTLARIAAQGPAGFYGGETALLIEREMQTRGGLITQADLKAYRPVRRAPLRGTYRGHEVLSMPPPSSGGTALIQMLNILEGYGLAANGWGSAEIVAPDDRGHAAGVRRSGAPPRGSRLQPVHADRETDLQGVRRGPARDDQA